MNESEQNRFGLNEDSRNGQNAVPDVPDGDETSDVLQADRLGKNRGEYHFGQTAAPTQNAVQPEPDADDTFEDVIGRADVRADQPQIRREETPAEPAAPAQDARPGGYAPNNGNDRNNAPYGGAPYGNAPYGNAGSAQYNNGSAQYNNGGAQYNNGGAQYNNGGAQYNNGSAQYNNGGAQQNPYPYANRQQDARPGGDYYRDVYAGAANPTQRDPYPYANKQYAYGDEQPPKKGKKGKVIFGVLIAVLVLAVAIGVVPKLFRGAQRTAAPSEPETGTIDNVDEVVTAASPEIRQNSTANALAPGEIYKKVLPSSVGVLVYDKSTKKLASEGSGVIFKEDNDGEYTYIVTCAHVISSRGVSLMVQLPDEEKYSAELIGFDSRTDIGVIRIKEHGLTACEIGDSDKLAVGDRVYAIGNPGGTEFANSFTDGIISAIDRPVSSSSTGYTMECIQHTAAINPGNSGGALVNALGQLIGINSMKIVASDYEGMGFSVPSSVFVKIVNELISSGYVTNRPKLGIRYVAAANEQAYAMFVGIKGLPAGSIIVYSISEDSSLADTDLQRGDLITEVNGEPLTNSGDLAAVVENSRVGDKLRLSIVRINNDYTYKEFEVTATLVEDKGDDVGEDEDEEEPTTSYFDDYFGDRDSDDGSYDDSYGDDYSSGPYSDEFFRDFFDRFFSRP